MEPPYRAFIGAFRRLAKGFSEDAQGRPSQNSGSGLEKSIILI
jgi:hypothetical protein